jgi:hypothetical protein
LNTLSLFNQKPRCPALFAQTEKERLPLAADKPPLLPSLFLSLSELPDSLLV